MSQAIFLLFSAITGFVEIGSIFWGIAHKFSLIQILMLVLAYQIGNFFPNDVTLSKRNILVLNLLQLIMAILLILDRNSFFLFFTSVLLLSPSIQTIRSIRKDEISTGRKRVFRILGFLLAPLLSLIPFLLISITAFIVCSFYEFDLPNKVKRINIDFPYHIMVFHQMHYFSYAYIIVFISAQNDRYNGFFTSLIFVMGWITYTLVPYIYKKKKYFVYFIVGHFLLLTLIISMFFLKSLWILFLWILTGFGGGTVFCIKEIFKISDKYEKSSLISSENYGHILGVLACIITFSITNVIKSSFLVASICVILTLICMFIFKGVISRKEKI